MSNPSRLENFPISFFFIVMGLCGLTIAWSTFQRAFGLQLNVDGALALFVAGLFVVLLFFYVRKILSFRDAVIRELHHPVKMNFFPSISISLLLLSIVSLHMLPAAAEPLWLMGAVMHIGFTLYIMSVWIHHDQFETHHINPAWFIPVVGNVLVPVVGMQLGYTEVSWFFFSIGIVFWIVLMTIIFYRIMFHSPLPEKLMPTLFILIAPPAVGFLSYMKLTGDLDAFARILYYVGLFLTLLLATQYRFFIRINFFLTWWAYSFPIAAITIATLVVYEHTGSVVHAGLGWVLVTLLTLLIIMLLYRTARAVSRHMICRPED
ncbi:MAG: C4-dicarboxylate ABC transporter [endosymbiont of Seepiophila jonesi]|uniref:C4-dicarboxylate ABC transporter n=1 Tax=endosymbiont of Lamellibrachia luymesi TaxID=2200907 RepID=A0A370DVF9_9GAMM|nr:MAG: C4-dicarboxylate ABC transporter [endosymbiont of Lamellibrachia luymesi]RDH93800.1 MAG: C4-dicarboxylate ABC transporter [endosymbiont of Seepiophila jonesi]